MTGLGVNIDHVASVRQARRTIEPDPVWAAVEAEIAGADCITFHLRKDRRHINDRDARLLKQTVRAKLNMEMSLDEEIVAMALELRPDQATLVPENRQEITTEGGLDVVSLAERMRDVTRRLQDAGIEVSAFIDPDPLQIAASAAAGCDAVELHTGTYANAFLACRARPRKHEAARRAALGEPVSPTKIADPVRQALETITAGRLLGVRENMDVHAGHGLTYQNVQTVAALGEFGEFNIGHSIIARAVFTGLREAVAEMKRLIVEASRS